jgi:hypothetical protein
MNRNKSPHCKYCRSAFKPAKPGAVVCSVECAQALAEKKRQKFQIREARERRVEIKKKLNAMKTLPMLKREAQIAFNKFIRERDADKPCICCGRFDVPGYSRGGKWDAGHYRSVGSAPHMRFIEANCHRQLKFCNSYGSGRAVDYRIGLIARIGLAAVEVLENDNEPRHYTKDDLRSLINFYKAKAKALTSCN